MRCVPLTALVLGSLFILSGCGKGGSSGDAADELLKGPATAEQAARVLDLSTFPVMEGASTPTNRNVAGLAYAAAGNAKAAFDFQRKKLTAQKWKETKDTTYTSETASGAFTRNGFVVSVTAYPASEGKLEIFLRNLGNVNLAKLPRPGATKSVYVGDSAAMYVTDAAVDATKQECRKLLLADGWQPYGAAGDSQFFKQNAVRVTTTVNSAPAQGGKTMIAYSSELMAADLPAPENAQELQYAETTKELSFETSSNKDEIVAFYQKALAPTGWKSTLEKTVDIDDRPTMIFRNPAKDMLTLSFSGARDGKLPVSLQHQSAAEIAQIEAEIKAHEPEIKAKIAAQRKAEEERYQEQHKPLPRVAVTLPNEAENVDASKDAIKFNVGKGRAKAVVEAWRKQYRDAGWKEDVATLEGMAGAVSLSHEKESLTINYTDTGFMPAEVNISALGAELELAK